MKVGYPTTRYLIKTHFGMCNKVVYEKQHMQEDTFCGTGTQVHSLHFVGSYVCNG